MFDFEEDELNKIESVVSDAYDMDLGLALSKSFVNAPGLQILTPKDVQKILTQKIEKMLSDS